MTHLITFTSSQFDVSRETPNPINPIAGQGILNWLRDKLISAGYEVTTPEPEDWGWYVHVNGRDGAYLVGASSDVDQPAPREWVIQIHRERSLKDKLLGRNKLAGDDALTARIETIVRDGGSAQDVQVDKGA
jgi:hypothetical protein